MPLFDNEEQSVRLLHDDRFAMINRFADLQASTAQNARRSALASAFLSRYLRERLVIEHDLSRNRRKRVRSRMSHVHASTNSNVTIASPVVSNRNTFTSRDHIAYILRFNAARRKDFEYTKATKLYFNSLVAFYTENPPKFSE